MEQACTDYARFSSENLTFSHVCYHTARQFPPHIHDVCELLYVKRGSITYTVESRVYHLARNSLILSRPMSLHAVSSESSAQYERSNILLDEKILAPELFARIPAGLDVITFDDDAIIPDLFRKMDYYCGRFEDALLRPLLEDLAREILYNVLIASGENERSRASAVNPLLDQAVTTIERNLTRPMSVEGICAELHVARSHLHHLFVQHLGISPKQYMLTKRLALAQRELRAGVKPTQVFLDCGFSDYSTFFRDYKRAFGRTPSQEMERPVRVAEP